MDEITVNATTGFKDNVKYTEKEFANIWRAMIGNKRPLFQPNVSEDGWKWSIQTIAMTYNGYGFFNDVAVEIDFTGQTAPIFYLWLRSNVTTNSFDIVFDETGNDLSLQNTETIGYEYLYDAIKNPLSGYKFADSPRLSDDNPLLKIFQPVVKNEVHNVNDTIDMGEAINNFKRIKMYCAAAGSTNRNNTVIDIIIPDEWGTGVTARGASAGNVATAGIISNIQINFVTNTSFKIMNNNQLWHNLSGSPAHKLYQNLRIVRLEAYRY